MVPWASRNAIWHHLNAYVATTEMVWPTHRRYAAVGIALQLHGWRKVERKRGGADGGEGEEGTVCVVSS